MGFKGGYPLPIIGRGYEALSYQTATGLVVRRFFYLILCLTSQPARLRLKTVFLDSLIYLQNMKKLIFLKTFFLHIFSADRENMSRDFVEFISKSLTHCVQYSLRNSTKSRHIFSRSVEKIWEKKCFSKIMFFIFCK